MISKRGSIIAVAGLMAIGGAGPAAAAPAEPLLVTSLPDPDPNYVPPPPEKKARRLESQSDEHPTLDQAMQNLGRVAGELARRVQAQAKQAQQKAADAPKD